jgi:hypothetical protein
LIAGRGKHFALLVVMSGQKGGWKEETSAGREEKLCCKTGKKSTRESASRRFHDRITGNNLYFDGGFFKPVLETKSAIFYFRYYLLILETKKQ